MSRLERIGRAWLWLTLLFLLAPVLILVVDSVNSATSFPSPFETLTLRWYEALVRRQDFLDGGLRSLEVALLAAAIATFASFLAAYGLSRAPLRGRHVIATALMGPLFVPEIVLSFAILQITGLLGIRIDLMTMSLTHAVFVMPFVLRLVLAAFSRFDFNLEDAARSLGARHAQALRHITIPIVRPSLVAGFMLSAILSFVNLPVSMFLTTAGTATLPVAMFAYMESRMDPMIAAAATLIVVLAAAATLLLDSILKVRVLG